MPSPEMRGQRLTCTARRKPAFESLIQGEVSAPGVLRWGTTFPSYTWVFVARMMLTMAELSLNRRHDKIQSASEIVRRKSPLLKKVCIEHVLAEWYQ